MDEIIKIIDLQQRKQYKKKSTNQQNKWGSYKNMFPNSTHTLFKKFYILGAKDRIQEGDR